MRDRMKLSQLRRTNLVRGGQPRSPETDSPIPVNKRPDCGWRWTPLAYENDRSASRARHLLVRVDDLQLFGDGSIILGDRKFPRSCRIDNHEFRGKVASRESGFARMLEVETSSESYRFLFTFDTWFVGTRSTPSRSLVAERVWRLTRIAYGLCAFAVRESRRLARFAKIVIIISIIVYILAQVILPTLYRRFLSD